MDKGSNWHKWDLHVHTASSYDYKYNGKDADEILVEAWKENELSAVAITDHFIIDYERIERIRKIITDKQYNITVFPGVELRTDKGSTNIHVILIFDDKSNIVNLAADFSAIMLRQKAKPKGEYNNDSIYWDYSDIIDFAKEHSAVISVHAGKKSNGIDKEITVNGLEHKIAMKKEYSESVHIYEVGRYKDVSDYKEHVFKNIKERPVIICSDNHNASDYSLKESLWIKGKLNFEGLKQSIIHCSERVFVGDKPDKLLSVEKNPEKYISKIVVSKKNTAINKDNWFDIDLQLNSGLTTIIGNKGSGKSALADFIGYIGKSNNLEMFSFLAKNRFCKEDKNYHLDYKGNITWRDDEKNSVENFDLYSNDGIQMVRYLPQRYIEETCNNLDKQFQKEIDEVIFSYVDEKDKGEASNLNDLIDSKVDDLNTQKMILRNRLSLLNEKIIKLERKTSKEYKKEINDKDIIKTSLKK